ncbi:HET-domain-containing protein [Rhizodiscina lignyota]|uniref:HET-domain-containing protein n=1 Tax=Rhizodiscina lignyota TaxID=1504668 RepID=A0A9P4IF28_9PEZI|nr:HET-domain-containing protein [Rhizodiscina lignyota]
MDNYFEENQSYRLRRLGYKYLAVTSHPYFPSPKNIALKLHLPAAFYETGPAGLLIRSVRSDVLFRHNYQLRLYNQNDGSRPKNSGFKIEDRYQYTALPTGRHIRLLRLEPGKGEDAIKCSFSTHDLSIVPQFVALSYTWGTNTPSQLISCEGASLGVTQNLWEALHHLRLEDRAPLLWIDALCIHQNDGAERNVQVSIMGEIYCAASQVIVWLGEPTDSIVSSLHLMRQLRAVAESPGRASLFVTDDPFVDSKTVSFSDGGLRLPEKHSPKWKQVEAVYWRHWWTRAWVVQELCLAREPIFTFGQWRLRAEDVLTTAAFLQESGIAAATMIDITNAVSLNNLRQMRLKGQRLILPDLLMKTRSRTSGDPRDKVYSLLGLCKEDAITVIPDYSKPTAQVYTELAVQYLSEGALDCLTAVCDPRWRAIPDLPSWAPDWSVASRVHEFLTPGDSLTTKASAESEANVHFSSNNSELRVTGMIFDSVKTICWPYLFPQIEEQILSFLPRSEDYMGSAFFKNIYGSFRLRQWERFALALKRYPLQASPPKSNQNHAKEIIYQVYLHTITAGAYPNEDLKAAYESYGKIHLLHPPDLEIAVADLKKAMAFRPWMEKACTGRRMFLTRKGYLGLAPYTTKRGDTVALLAGGKTPYVLMSAKYGKFRLRGECYIHGIMHGEAWNDESSKREICII